MKNYIYHDDLKIELFYNNNNEISRENKPAILVYKNNKLISWAYCLNNKLHRQCKPAFYYRNDNRIIISAIDGLIHSDNSLYYKDKNTSIKASFFYGILHQNEKSSLLIRNSNKENLFYIKNGFGIKGFNSFKKENNLLTKSKLNLCFNKNLFGEYLTSFFLLENIIKNPIIISDLFLMHTEPKKFQKPFNDSPNQVKTSLTGNKIFQIQWKKEFNSFYRKDNKPTIINYLKQSIQYYHFNDTKKQETLFIPYFYAKKRNEKMNILNFTFNNESVQNFYNQNNLCPFYLSLSERKSLHSNFH